MDQLVFDGPDKAKLLEKKDVFDEEDDVTLEETFPELRVQSGVHVRGAKALKKGGNTMAQVWPLNQFFSVCICVKNHCLEGKSITPLQGG